MLERIGLIGYGGTDKRLEELAYRVGSVIAKQKAVLVCGGLGGVMESGCRGAKESNGITIGIIPGSSEHDANEYVDIPVITGMGEARNIIVVRSSQALIAIGGGFGTLSEISFALKLGKPVVGLESWDISEEIIKAETPSEAALKALELASNKNF